jgi:hypothetical protein
MNNYKEKLFKLILLLCWPLYRYYASDDTRYEIIALQALEEHGAVAL